MCTQRTQCCSFCGVGQRCVIFGVNSIRPRVYQSRTESPTRFVLQYLWNKAINHIAVFSTNSVILRCIRYDIQWLIASFQRYWSTNRRSFSPWLKNLRPYYSYHSKFIYSKNNHSVHSANHTSYPFILLVFIYFIQFRYERIMKIT